MPSGTLSCQPQLHCFRPIGNSFIYIAFIDNIANHDIVINPRATCLPHHLLREGPVRATALAVAACLVCALLCGQLAPQRGALPGIHVSPPVSPEEAEALTKIKRLSQQIELGSDNGLEELRAAIEEHFDLLTRRAEDRMEELRKHLEATTGSLTRRKAARKDLIEAELRRILHDQQAISFYPETLSLLRSIGGPTRPQTGRPIEKPAE